MTTTAETTSIDDLAERRRAAGLTQQQLADRANVSVGAVRKIEQGHVSPSRSYAARVLRGVLDDLAA